jgi:hypothetical protein
MQKKKTKPNGINELVYINYDSTHQDGLTNKIMKSCRQQFSKPLTYVINKSLSTGVYPERLKYAIINPIHKKGDKTLISNYRPTSLVTGFAKVFETAIFRRLSDHTETHKIILPEQFGFRSGLSTEDAIRVYKLTWYLQLGICNWHIL